jgi:hypothetical protein
VVYSICQVLAVPYETAKCMQKIQISWQPLRTILVHFNRVPEAPKKHSCSVSLHACQNFFRRETRLLLQLEGNISPSIKPEIHIVEQNDYSKCQMPTSTRRLSSICLTSCMEAIRTSFFPAVLIWITVPGASCLTLWKSTR